MNLPVGSNDPRWVAEVGDSAGIGSTDPAPCSEVLPQRNRAVNLLLGDLGLDESSMKPKATPPSSGRDMFGCMGAIGVYADSDALRVCVVMVERSILGEYIFRLDSLMSLAWLGETVLLGYVRREESCCCMLLC